MLLDGTVCGLLFTTTTMSMSPEFSQDDSFWFHDGNVVLITTDKKGFCVHLGVLARHCQYFKDMIDGACAPADSTGLPATLNLDDSSDELQGFLAYFYEPPYVHIYTDLGRL